MSRENRLCFRNLRIWDGRSNGIDHGLDCIVVENGRITYIGSSEDQGDGMDMGGMTLIPGLIDAHIHLCLNPDIRDPFQQDRLPEPELLEQMADRARQMLRSGITTARDLGGGQGLELRIRDAIKRGELAGPRLLCSGQPITSVRGHCHFWGGEAADDEEVMAVLDRQVSRSVDLIKVMATGGNITPGSKPAESQFSERTLSMIVERAGSKGLHVAAHCHGTSGIGNAARAGVRTIEHCSWVGENGWAGNYDAGVVETIVEKGSWVSPTVNAGWKRHVGNVEYEKKVRGNFEEMKKAGVRLIASTDAGIPNVRHHDLPLAIPVFARFAGLSAIEVLRAATSDCAEAIGLGEITGRIAEGYAADLVLYDGDPTRDLKILENPHAVYQAGKIVTG